MSNNTLIIIALIAYAVASFFDARSSLQLKRAGGGELIPLYWDKKRQFNLVSYVIITVIVVIITMVFSYPEYPTETIYVFFGLAAFKLAVAFIWNPSRIKKARNA